MPCLDPGADSYDLGRCRERLDAATAVACAALNALERNGIPVPAECQSWWMNHQEQDRRREKAEAEKRQIIDTRNSALRKLTPEEQRALGILP